MKQQNFRNLNTPELRFEHGVTGVVGANAAGKSNLIDALYFAATANLPAGTVAETLRFGEGEGFVGATLEVSGTQHEVALGLAVGRRSIRLDGQAVRAADVARLGGAVRIAPEDADLVHGPPSLRRDFLDDVLGRLSLRYALMIREYHRVVEQRNAVLKDPRAAATLPAWDPRFVALGDEIDALRRRVVARIAPLAAQAYADIALDGKRLAVTLSRAAGEQSLQDAMRGVADEERARGVTLVGPHRDDLGLALDGRDVRTFGSRGEARTASLALRVSEFALLEERHDTPPLLLIDDVSAELDGNRRRYLMTLARRTPQVVVTGTEAPPEFDRLWRIVDGNIEAIDG